ncbi:MAG TPA: hypothetical protein VG797_07095, partial [Phycisphaerales bacterium]|nr:hypothetical protein [Phycisphaerales bacterium]
MRTMADDVQALPELGSGLLGERLIAMARQAATLHASREAEWRTEFPDFEWDFAHRASTKPVTCLESRRS